MMITNCNTSSIKKRFFDENTSICFDETTGTIIVRREEYLQHIKIAERIAEIMRRNHSYYKDMLVGYVLGYNKGIFDSLED